MNTHSDEDTGHPIGPDDRLLREIRQASGDLWRSARRRTVGWSSVCLVGTQAILWCALRLLPGEAPTEASRGSLAWTAWSSLVLIALGSGLALAVLDGLQALVADGPLLAALGKALRPPDPSQPGVSPVERFAAFGSPRALSRAARLPDLPLIVFLVRAVLGVDAKRLLTLAQGGADRETILRELVRLAQARAATSLHRARLVVWAILGLAAGLATLAVRLFTG
jgi:hypothetical protein